MDDTLNLSGLFSINPTFPKNDIFADYIYYNPENGNGSLENSLIKDINEEIKIIDNKKKDNSNFLINKIPNNSKIEIKSFLSQKKIFETYNENEKEIQKQKKLMMNRISAKKSRLKKKVYVKCLEDELKKMKNEIEEKNNFEKNFFQGISKEKNELNHISSIIKIYQKLLNQENIILNKSKSENETLNDYVYLQKKIVLDFLIKQIQFLIPIKCKIFQNKYLKLKKFELNDSIFDINSKINENLEMLKELYDFEMPLKNLKKKKNDSMAFQLYSYYYNLKNYIDSFKNIFDDIY
jgi:hypothetical protein